jgi:hypothetical protein
MENMDYISDLEGYFEELILNTGFIENIEDLTSSQLELLNNIKNNFEKISEDGSKEAIKVFDEYYEDSNGVSEIYITGLILYGDENSFELYFSHKDALEKFLVVIVLFQNGKITGTTTID